MTYDTVATLSQVTSLLLFIAHVPRRRSPTRFWPKNGPRFEEAQRRALDLDRKPSQD